MLVLFRFYYLCSTNIVLMKKLSSFLVFLAVLGLNLSISSCNKENENGSDFVSSDLVGMWVPTEYADRNFYWEFTKDKHIKYYVLNSTYNSPDCYFDNGTLYYPSGCTWDLEMYDEYEIMDDCIFFDGINMGNVTRINKDKYYFISDLLTDGFVERVKNLKTFDW